MSTEITYPAVVPPAVQEIYDRNHAALTVFLKAVDQLKSLDVKFAISISYTEEDLEVLNDYVLKNDLINPANGWFQSVTSGFSAADTKELHALLQPKLPALE